MKVEQLQDSFEHEAMIYKGLEDFLERTSAFIGAGVQAAEPVLVVVDSLKVDLLSARFEGASGVRFLDMGSAGVNPNRIIPLWRDFVSENSRAKSFRGVGEPVWAERTPDELAECQRHEMLLNLAFMGTGPWRLMCPYDASTLPKAVIDEALASHPLYSEGAPATPSDRYRGLADAQKPFTAPLPEPSAVKVDMSFMPADLPLVRELVREAAAAGGLLPRRGEELVIAVNELVTNSMRYGGGQGRLRIWDEGGTVICEVSDHGTIQDPLAGRHRPAEGATGGYGLWMVNQLCDLVQLRSSENGTTIRVHMRTL